MMDKNMTYEAALNRIEEITALLEKNEAALDDSIKLFEEGMELTAFCSEKLNCAKQKITMLTKE